MLKIRGISKIYGNFKALDALSFEAEAGEIIGLLGPNGSGKSTTLKILATLVGPNSGDVDYKDLSLKNSISTIREKISYVPEVSAVYPELRVSEYLTLMAKLKKVSQPKEKVAEQIEQFNLGPVQKKLCAQLSKGFRQRLSLAQALISDPEYLFLDEPNTGLDPEHLIELRTILKKVSKDTLIILSSHQLQEVEKLCTRVIGLSFGQKVFDHQLNDVENISEIYNSLYGNTNETNL